jgi:hypothetical protein
VISSSQRLPPTQDNTTYKISMPRAGFDPATPPTKRPQTYALDRAATEIGDSKHDPNLICSYFLRGCNFYYHRTQKCKSCPAAPCRRQGGEEVQLLLFLDLGTRWGVSGQRHDRSRFSPGERTPGTTDWTRDRRLGGPQSWSGHRG